MRERENSRFPVDSSATFLDIGTDSFSQSLYDDLGDINLTDFGELQIACMLGFFSQIKETFSLKSIFVIEF